MSVMSSAVPATLVSMAECHLVTGYVCGRPSSYPTAHQEPWKDLVRKAVTTTGVQPQDARFAVRLEFRIPASRSVNKMWDLDGDTR